MTQSVGREPMSFSVGDEVVCVDARFDPDWRPYRPDREYVGGLDGLKEGAHYHVRWAGIFEDEGVFCVRLEEILRPPHPDCPDDGPDYPYDAKRFRPVKREAIELFRQMATSPKPLVPVADPVGDIEAFSGLLDRLMGGKD